MEEPVAIKLTVNGKKHNIDEDPETPLLWILRDTLGLTGTKYGCGIAACGACTVHIDGVAERSCSIPLEFAENSNILTIEGLSEDRSHPVQKAWIEEDVPQCGYCQSGMILSVGSLLKDVPSPSDEDINDYITNICRCGTYTRIRKAIKRAAKINK